MRLKTAIPALAVLALLIGTDAAQAVPGWNVTNIDNTATNPTNANFITLARNPDGAYILREEVRPYINYADSATAQNGAFVDPTFPEFVFLNEIAAGGVDQNQFLQRHTGWIQIPQSGTWSLHNQTDDPFYVQIATNSGIASWTDTSCCNNQQTTLQLDAGLFPIEVIMAEFGGGDHVEFAMAFGGSPGAPLAFSTTTYHLVGDTQNGGLLVVTNIPEPATLSLLAFGSLGLLRRRRQA